MTVRVALFASGEGSNVRALVRACGPSWQPALLVSDRAEAPVVAWATEAGIPVHLLPARGDDPDGTALVETLEVAGAEILVLAGFLRLIPASVVSQWAGRILNIHPSLLPAFGGAGMYGRRVHEAVLASGLQVTGVTVHQVTERFDEGPILAQWPVMVRSSDTAATLASRIQAVEHAIYPPVVEALARSILTGTTLPPPETLVPLTLTFP